MEELFDQINHYADAGDSYWKWKTINRHSIEDNPWFQQDLHNPFLVIHYCTILAYLDPSNKLSQLFKNGKEEFVIGKAVANRLSHLPHILHAISIHTKTELSTISPFAQRIGIEETNKVFQIFSAGLIPTILYLRNMWPMEECDRNEYEKLSLALGLIKAQCENNAANKKPWTSAFIELQRQIELGKELPSNTCLLRDIESRSEVNLYNVLSSIQLRGTHAKFEALEWDSKKFGDAWNRLKYNVERVSYFLERYRLRELGECCDDTHYDFIKLYINTTCNVLSTIAEDFDEDMSNRLNDLTEHCTEKSSTLNSVILSHKLPNASANADEKKKRMAYKMFWHQPKTLFGTFPSAFYLKFEAMYGAPISMTSEEDKCLIPFCQNKSRRRKLCEKHSKFWKAEAEKEFVHNKVEQEEVEATSQRKENTFSKVLYSNFFTHSLPLIHFPTKLNNVIQVRIPYTENYSNDLKGELYVKLSKEKSFYGKQTEIELDFECSEDSIAVDSLTLQNQLNPILCKEQIHKFEDLLTKVKSILKEESLLTSIQANKRAQLSVPIQWIPLIFDIAANPRYKSDLPSYQLLFLLLRPLYHHLIVSKAGYDDALRCCVKELVLIHNLIKRRNAALDIIISNNAFSISTPSLQISLEVIYKKIDLNRGRILKNDITRTKLQCGFSEESIKSIYNLFNSPSKTNYILSSYSRKLPSLDAPLLLAEHNPTHKKQVYKETKRGSRMLAYAALPVMIEEFLPNKLKFRYSRLDAIDKLMKADFRKFGFRGEAYDEQILILERENLKIQNKILIKAGTHYIIDLLLSIADVLELLPMLNDEEEPEKLEDTRKRKRIDTNDKQPGVKIQKTCHE